MGSSSVSNRLNVAPNDLNAFWMPFTANRQFKKAPRMFARAKDMHYYTVDGREVLDGTAGPLVRQRRPLPPQDRRGDRRSRPPSSTTRPPSRWATRRRSSSPMRWSRSRPQGMDHVLYTNSGSESVETALKVALAYHRVKGDGARFRLIGRERGLSRRQFRRHLGRRHRHQPQDVRHAADRRRPHAAHP